MDAVDIGGDGIGGVVMSDTSAAIGGDMGAGGVVKDSWLRVAGGDTGVAIKGEGGKAVTPVTAGDGGVADTVAVETASPAQCINSD